MSFVMFTTWLLVGALAGWLAGFVMKRGGHKLKTDIFLGLAGSIGGSWIFRGLFYSGGGMFTGVVVAGIGAVIPIIAQRIVWPTERLGHGKGTGDHGGDVSRGDRPLPRHYRSPVMATTHPVRPDVKVSE